MSKARTKLIEGGVQSLREFGYPDCDDDNILTDEVYREFFKHMLEETKGGNDVLDVEIDKLLTEIDRPRISAPRISCPRP